MEIEKIIKDKKATVGVAIESADGKDTMSVNGTMHFPLQSVFKLHIGIVMLSEIDKGNFSLDQQITIKKEELLPGYYSPLRDEYPDGATLPISTILEKTISLSDNVGCDVLLRLLGGPKKIEAYFKNLGFNEIQLTYNEEVMQSQWDNQFQNWSTPQCSNAILKAFYTNDRKLLSPTTHAFLWRVLKETSTCPMRLKGQLPEGTVVAHKTGTSGYNEQTGISAATNDMGLIFLPNNDFFYITIYVTNSSESKLDTEKIIADIAMAAYEHFKVKKP